MHDLAPLTPLGAASPRTDRIGALVIREVTERALASVTCRREQDAGFAHAATRLFGITPPAPGRWAESGDWSLIWTGPDQWFAEAPFESHEEIARIVKDGFGPSASITEQTDGWVRFDIEGPTVIELMERLCPLPTRRMETGAATRSIIEHMGCLVICRSAGVRFSLIAPRSFAGSLHHALVAAAHSIA